MPAAKREHGSKAGFRRFCSLFFCGVYALDVLNERGFI